ncbi:MAG: hypothetical protein GC150_12500 [Rhizobiales bacterium]|nr:hypothetical protein [Hyphomicrobiales bacterium]
MGIILEFGPRESGTRRRRVASTGDGNCEVVIFPGVRIERYGDRPQQSDTRLAAAGIPGE